MADSLEKKGTKTSATKKSIVPKQVLTDINGSSQIALYPLYGGSYDKSDTLVLPVSPSDLMFNEDSDAQVVKLINYGELPVGMNRKLVTWSIESFFPYRYTHTPTYSTNGAKAYNHANTFKHWFDVSDGVQLPYDYYCDVLLKWKNEQTPLVFFFKTWGSYYNCQIKKFSYGRKDSIGNVYYQLEFQEFKEYTIFDNGAASNDYSSDTYTPKDGESILQLCKKVYGSSDKYPSFMALNGLTIPEVKAGVTYKVK